MIQQRHICIAGTLRHGAAPDLEALLATMNAKPGQADPHNALVPFGRLDQIHVARFVIPDDPSLADREIAPSLPTIEPVRLAFMADFDGGKRALINELVEVAEPGLRRIFSHCTDFGPETDLQHWMLAHRVKSAAVYRNWPGRSTLQIREEAKLHRALRAARLAHPEASPDELRTILRQAGSEVALAPVSKPAMAWKVRQALNFLLQPLIAPLLIVMLRGREKTDAVLTPVPSRGRNRLLSALPQFVTVKGGAYFFLPGLRGWEMILAE